MSGILSSPKAPAAPAAPPPPPVMPTPDDEAVNAAKKKRVARLSAVGGRESTFLTSPFGSGGSSVKMGG